MYNTVGVVLSGGASRRFGSFKAKATYKGEYFFRIAENALTPHVDKVVVISHPELTSWIKENSNALVVEDLHQYKGLGPLAGIFTAMQTLESYWYFVLSCDVPYITSDIISKISQGKSVLFDGIVPYIEGRLQPLVAMYSNNVRPLIKSQLDQVNFRMCDTINQLNIKQVSEKTLGVDPVCFKNINSFVDYKLLD
ncbi:molybdenum cofactor guanylyltransferase [Bacillus spongiae]|uniref:Probable molybdenum cofactor guanylyltransferase n=1 Tax=Bacillus spongiae TaxID=2683610 RepID=A0ABU8HAF6_9BACI